MFSCSHPFYRYFFAFLLIGLLNPGVCLFGQCNAPIAIFPYHENFETGPGGWNAGGLSNDWALGTPNKPTINGAASGNNCWITGGLTTSFYNFGERSYVESPCFDFTNLAHPYIFFNIWWESERQYDGANFQYSLDGGTNWTNVGATNDPSDCLNQNWFNSSAITHLSNLATVRDGWAGNIQPTSGSCLGGNGSKDWVTARHCMPYLAGKPNVLFRFTFGAGTTCNDFDGIAFDDIHIENAPAIQADFSFTCLGTDTIAFTNLSTLCPDAWNWNFGDPGSGVSNTATLENPLHRFSAPGMYTITLEATSLCAAGSITSQTINVVEANISSTAADCAGSNNGTATAQVIPAGGNPNFNWNTTPAQSGSTATNLPAGIYTVTITATGACPTTASVTIDQPAPLQHEIIVVPAYCGNPTGSVNIQESGGTAPYSFTWMPPVSNSNSANNLPVGNYRIDITDQNGCRDSIQIEIESQLLQIAPEQINPVRCFGGLDGNIQLAAPTGIAPFSYAWSTPAGNGLMATGLPAGNYTVTVSDANNCTGSLTLTIVQPEALNALISANGVRCFGDSDGIISVDSVTGGTTPYLFALGQMPFGHLPVFTGLNPGNYSVLVEDANGCQIQNNLLITEPALNAIQVSPDTSIFQGSAVQLSGTIADPGRVVQYEWKPATGLECAFCLSTLAVPPTSLKYILCATDSSGCVSTDSLTIQVEPGSVYLPNIFSPASSLLNNHFTVYAGNNVEQVDLLQIFDRWGSLVFENKNFSASDPLSGWDGRINGDFAAIGIYVYNIRVKFIDGASQTYSGDILLVR